MTAGDSIRDWTTPGRPPLVPEVTLLLAEDMHRTWSALDEEAPPFWAFAWVGGQALARHVLDHPDLVRGRRVLDLASGSGLVAIAALRAGATAAIASDTDARARAAIVLNAQANDVEIDVVGDVLDADEPLDVDLVLAGDVFYEQPMARLVERFCDEAVAVGVDVVVGDPGREYLPRRRVTALGSYDVVGTLDLEGGETTRTTVYRFT